MNAIVSARILTLVQTGLTLQQAMDQVLGAGSFAALAGQVYDGIKARAA